MSSSLLSRRCAVRAATVLAVATAPVLFGAMPPDALAQALAWADQLQAVPARACANIKRLVRSAGSWEIEQGRSAERTLFCDCMVDPAALPLMADVAQGERTIAQQPQAARPQP